jgi:hypothetical protein
MTDAELTEYANLLDDAIKGKWVTLCCRDQRAVRNAFHDLTRLADHMGLAYKAYRQVGHEQIVIGDRLSDGGIDFEVKSCISQYRSARRAGDPRAR